MTVLVLPPAGKCQIGAMRDEHRHRYGGQPFPHVDRAELRNQRRHGRSDEIARAAPQEVLPPHPPEALIGGERRSARDCGAVDQEKCAHREDYGLRVARPDERGDVTAGESVHRAGRLHCYHGRRDVEDDSMRRVAMRHPQHRLAERADASDEHRLMGTEQQQGGEIDDERRRHRGAVLHRRNAQLERGCQDRRRRQP